MTSATEIDVLPSAACEAESSWPTKRLKFLTRHIGSGKTPHGGAANYQSSGVLLIRSQNVRNDGLRLDEAAFIDDEADNELRASRVFTGDVLLNITGASIGRCAIVGSIGRANVNQHVCIVRSGSTKLCPSFLHYALLSHRLQHAIFSSENGVSREGLNFRQLGNFEIPLPKLEQQLSIAAYLDRETARIDRLIAEKTRLTELLAEKRAAVITHAVTWYVGHSCQFTSFRRFVKSLEQGWSPQADQRLADADEWAVIKVGAVFKGQFRESEHKALPPGVEPEAKYEIKPGDFLMTRGNTPELVADVCVVPQNVRPRLMISDLHYRIRLDERRLTRDFAALWFLSKAGRSQIEADARGTSNSMVKVSQNHIRTWKVTLPPLHEQLAIVADVAARMQRFDSLESEIRKGFEKLREYRSALITAAVTGRIDVRGKEPSS